MIKGMYVVVENVKVKSSINVDLIRSVQAGNMDSFEELYKQYYYYVLKIGYDYFRNRAKAEDVTQDVFIIVYKNIHGLTNPEMFVAWLNRVTYNYCHRLYAKEKRDSIGYIYASDDENYIESIKDEEVDSLKRIEEQHIKQVIFEILQEMKEDNRIIGYLRFYEELSYQEISERMKIPLGTIATKLKRIKEKLQKELKKRGISSGYMSMLLLPTIGIGDPPVVKKIFKSALKSSKGAFNLSNLLIPTVTLATAVVAPVAINNLQVQVTGENIGEYATIQEIIYDDKLTNESIPVDIRTTSSEFSKVLLDGQEELMIKDNGTHTIELYKDDEIIDSKQIEIINIDLKKPEVRETDQKDFLLLNISDNQGIDYQNIQMFVNGVTSQDYLLDKESNTIQIAKNIKYKINIIIPDIAGNQLDFDINFYEIDKI